MKILKEITLIALTIFVAFSCLTACMGEKQTKLDPEATKYLPLAKKYCSQHNLKLGNYLGKTIIRSKNEQQAENNKEPVVYEWKVVNKKSNKPFVIWVGPVMPMFPNLKPAVTLGKGRYTLGKVTKLK